MYVTAQESRALSRLFGLLAEDFAEREVRERIGHHLLELLSADHYASFVWDTPSRRFGAGVWLNMSPDNLASYDAYYQYNDPITFKLQARREPTLVTQIMPQRELMRTEFFNDFLARDGLYWGVNLYSYAGERNIGELAAPCKMSFAAASKHVRVLESAGLVRRRVEGRRHICRIEAAPLAAAEKWLRYYDRFWNKRLDALEALLKAQDEDRKGNVK